MTTPNKGSEKRRHRRQGTKLDAVMAIGDKTSIQCVILDFCEQGLFLQLKNPSVVGLHKGKGTKIYFSALIDSSREYFQIDAQIARVAEDGVGVVFDSISESMFQAFTQATNLGSIAAYSNNPRFYLTSSNQDRFKGAFHHMLNEYLPGLMNAFFNDAEDELEKTTDYAENFNDVAAQTNLISVLRMNKAELSAKYCHSVISGIEFTGINDSPNQGTSALETTLSLVEKESFEDTLNFSALVRKINTQYLQQLYQLELKLSYVTSFPRYLIKNPIAPEYLCNCFKKEIAYIEESVLIKKSLYKAFQKTLSNYLSPIYTAFEALLVEHGAPKDKAQDIVWKKNFPTTTKQEVSSNSSSPGLGHQLPTFDNDAYHYSDDSSYLHESVTPAIPLSRPSRTTYQQPVSQTANKLFQLINQGLAANLTSSEFAQSPENSQTDHVKQSEYTADELLSALTKLQATKSQQQSLDATSLLRSELSQSLGSTGFIDSKTFSTDDKSKLDVYDQLFEALLRELSLNPNIKSYLESIKLPLMALSLQDPKFLDSENHPARNLLNQLFSLDSAVNQNKIIKNTQIKQILEQMMSRIAQGSITNPDIFAKTNEELKELTGPITKSKEANIRRVIEVYQGKQKLEKARNKIQTEIDSRISNKTIPNVIQILLESGWQHLLVMTELNDERANRQRYLEVIDELLAWYTDLNQMPQEQFNIIEIELEFINSVLASVCANAFIHKQIMDELFETLIGVGSPKVRKQVESSFIKAKPKEAQNEFISDRWYLQVDQFEVGDWFTFSLEKEAFEPLKLIWVGEVPVNYVFVNRDGYKKQDLSRNELAELLESGVVAQIDNLDEPVMDRATTTMLQQMQEKLIHSVSHDPVTNLPNRKRFISLIKEQVTKFTNTQHLLCSIEIEDFRIITNVCGLAGGDQLLVQIAQLIKTKLGKSGIVSRLGDKTFGFMTDILTPEEGQETAKQIRNQINKSSFVWEDKSFTISVSMGLVPILEGASHNIEELLQKADSLIISAKRTGHNRIRLFQENDESLKAQTNIHEWAGRIDRIFAEKRLFARCQMISPIFPEKNNHSHYEILLGIRDELGNVIPPDDFIPAVEQCQRMPEIDRWVVETVFDWIANNRSTFNSMGGFAINLSGQSLNSEDFLTFLKECLTAQTVPPEKITFEVTETVAAGSLVFTKRFIKEIKQFGCKFSLDDFGTGYSSYSYLKSLDVDYLKIDGSFIKDIANSPTDMVMVNSMNEIAHSLEIETIAEYVENMKIHAILKEIGVDYAQGWGIHKPMPLNELTNSLK